MSSPRRAVLYTGGSTGLCSPLHGGYESGECRIYRATDDDDGPSLQTPQGKYLSVNCWRTLYMFQSFQYYKMKVFMMVT